MRENEAIAHALVAQLATLGLAALVDGSGVHWSVEVAPVATRGLTVHCFWYECEVGALILGVNPANQRSQLRGAPQPYEGPEYDVILHADGTRIAYGRTRSEAEVVACARAWLAAASLDQLVREVPFIDRRPRAMRAIAARLDPSLRWDVVDPACELWVYGGDRSCMILDDSCSFFIGQAQVARAAALVDMPGAVAAWLSARMDVRELAAEVEGVELEHHAEVLEQDPARWHWLHLMDRIANPHDVLVPLRPLIETLATRAVVKTFYSFSSLNRLCFSASSHFPWVNDHLPVVSPSPEGVFVVDGVPYALPRAVDRIERTLNTYPVQPFFGSEPHHLLPQLVDALAKQGAPLRPALVQRGAWYRLEVEHGGRRCDVSAGQVVFIDGDVRRTATWSSLDHAADLILRYFESSS